LSPRRELTFDSVTAAMEAAARGRGILLGMDPIAWDAPISSKLVRALPDQVEGNASYYLVYRKSDLARPKVRTFVEWLLAEMATYKRKLRR
jgi:LysR family glycine cleavage system transcriptional activator